MNTDENKSLIRVHPCSSVAKSPFLGPRDLGGGPVGGDVARRRSVLPVAGLLQVQSIPRKGAFVRRFSAMLRDGGSAPSTAPLVRQNATLRGPGQSGRHR